MNFLFRKQENLTLFEIHNKLEELDELDYSSGEDSGMNDFVKNLS